MRFQSSLLLWLLLVTPVPVIADPPNSAGSAASGVHCRDNGSQLTLLVGDKPVLSYHYRTAEPPAGIDPIYARSGFIHPLLTPGGIALTDDFPPDHAHQHGIFTAWVNTSFRGHHVDFWNQRDQSGTVRHHAINNTTSGPDHAEFQVTLHHAAHPAQLKEEIVLEETWSVRAHDDADPFVVDFESRQRCIADAPLILHQYHYGGFGYRGNRAWGDEPTFGFLTSEGKTRLDGNHTRAKWVVMHGQVDGKPAYVAVLDHPGNFRAPQPVRLHPSMPYFSYSPVVLGGFEIAPGQTYITRYRLLAGDGEPDRSAIDRAWQQYSQEE